MPLRKALLLGVAVALVAGCDSELLTSDTDLLRGRWLTEPQATDPSGSWSRELIFSASGRYAQTVRVRGLYPRRFP